jgi:hypothetical protein
MMQQLFDSFERLFLNFSFRRLIFWLFVVTLIGVGLYYGERATNYLHLWRIEKKILLLKELDALDKNGMAKNSQLGPIYNDLVVELTKQKPDMPALNVDFSGRRIGGFFIGASLAWALFLVAVFGSLFGNLNIATKAASMMVLWGIIFGIIGTLLPANITIKCAILILIPVQVLAFIIVIFYLPQKREV